jgi:WD40 repeat protein
MVQVQSGSRMIATLRSDGSPSPLTVNILCWYVGIPLCKSGHSLGRGESSKSAIQSVAFLRSPKQCIRPMSHSIVQVSSLSDEHVEIVDRHTRYVSSVMFSNYGQHIATVSANDTVRVWSASGKHKGVSSCHSILERPATFSDDSCWVKVTPCHPSHWPVTRSVSTWERPNWWKNITFSGIGDIKPEQVRIPMTHIL